MPSFIFNGIAIVLIFLIPSLSHLTGIALYKFDPMRLMLFAAILITNRKNSYLIAILLPLVSFLISAHPYLYKVALISGELVINLWLFYYLITKTKNVFFSTLISIVTSKAIYYLVKYILIRSFMVNDHLVGTSFTFQLALVFILSLLMSIYFKRNLIK